MKEDEFSLEESIQQDLTELMARKPKISLEKSGICGPDEAVCTKLLSKQLNNNVTSEIYSVSTVRTYTKKLIPLTDLTTFEIKTDSDNIKAIVSIDLFCPFNIYEVEICGFSNVSPNRLQMEFPDTFKLQKKFPNTWLFTEMVPSENGPERWKFQDGASESLMLGCRNHYEIFNNYIRPKELIFPWLLWGQGVNFKIFGDAKSSYEIGQDVIVKLYTYNLYHKRVYPNKEVISYFQFS